MLNVIIKTTYIKSLEKNFKICYNIYMMTSNKETKKFGKIVLSIENNKDGKCIYYSYKNKTEGRYFSNDEIAKDEYALGKTLADLILVTPNTKAIDNDVNNCCKYVSTNIFKKS